ncbi:hypothetical protein [Riemerella columbina]|uniref:hypothetical protein n=1 Tax=Riemerella columbina TaxID=103810 RepID=UPI000364F421|nr:hypothetical protein [Riemerella columbina]
MKKILLLTLLMSFTLSINAQETSDTSEVSSQRMNDIMISPFPTIAGTHVNVSYERLLNAESGIGLDAFVSIENGGGSSQFSPYYRMYFGKKYAAGFFVEGFLPITSSKYIVHHYYFDHSGASMAYPEEKRLTTFGLGIGLGGKWYTKKNIIFEASFGIARRFGNNEESYDYSPITGKGMLGIGYRF